MKRTYIWSLVLVGVAVLVALAIRNCTSVLDGGLAGRDANGDGVRDDVEAFIETEYGSNKRVRSVARQLSKAIQDEVVHPETADPDGAEKAMTCLRHVIGNDHVRIYSILEAVEGAVANTYPRIRGYIKFNARFNGQIVSAYPDLKSACSFDESLLQ